ncbi:MAG: hypothetical protein C0424_04700 [Sphingobacteriaceae bacterium]|nr:hypothetical protein [Sphingobacteriaceae bacterium]
MYRKITFFIAFILISTTASSQKSEILKLDEKNAYQYKSYYEDGSVKSIVGFYAKKPYTSVESFETKLKEYKVKYNGERKEYYQSGQLKEIVVYEKGKVTQFMKQYFEDGEEYSVPADVMPEFQFPIQQQNIWFGQKIKEIESKYNVQLQGNVVIALDISKDGTIKSLKVHTPDETQKKYLLEIGNQIEVKKPAKKNGQDIGTKFAFRIAL